MPKRFFSVILWSEETKKGVVEKYAFSEEKLIDAQFLPKYIKDFGQPSFLEEVAKENILSQMQSASIKLSQ